MFHSMLYGLGFSFKTYDPFCFKFSLYAFRHLSMGLFLYACSIQAIHISVQREGYVVTFTILIVPWSIQNQSGFTQSKV